MARLRVNIPDALDQKFRKKIASLFGFKRGALSKAVVDALQKWSAENNEPWVTVTDAVSFDIDPTVSIDFISRLAHVLPTKSAAISFKTKPQLVNPIRSVCPRCEVEDSEIIATISVGDIEDFFKALVPLISIEEMSSLLLEFEDGSYIVSGGQGCFYLKSKSLSDEQKQTIISLVLTIHGKEEFATQLTKKLPSHFDLIVHNRESMPIIVETSRIAYEQG